MSPQRAVFLCILLLLPGTAARGQIAPVPPFPGSKHTLGYSLGFQQSREELLMPKVHRGSIHIFNYQYENIKDRYQSYTVNMAYGRLKTVIEDEYATIHAGAWMRYRHAFNVLRPGAIRFYIGPAAAARMSFSYYESWDESHAYWAEYLSLGPSGVLCVPHRDHLWLTSLDLSLFGCYTRPDPVRLHADEDGSLSDILKDINRGFRAGTFSDAGQLEVTTEYRTPLARGGFLALAYTFQWTRIGAPDGRPLTELLHGVGLRIAL